MIKPTCEVCKKEISQDDIARAMWEMFNKPRVICGECAKQNKAQPQGDNQTNL